MSMSDRQIIHLLTNERRHQDAKWGVEFKGRTDERWLAILIEEVGELAQSFLQWGRPGEFQAEADDHIEEELVQVMAVAASWLEFRTQRSEQMPYEIQTKGYEHLQSQTGKEE